MNDFLRVIPALFMVAAGCLTPDGGGGETLSPTPTESSTVSSAPLPKHAPDSIEDSYGWLRLTGFFQLLWFDFDGNTVVWSESNTGPHWNFSAYVVPQNVLARPEILADGLPGLIMGSSGSAAFWMTPPGGGPRGRDYDANQISYWVPESGQQRWFDLRHVGEIDFMYGFDGEWALLIDENGTDERPDNLLAHHPATNRTILLYRGTTTQQGLPHGDLLMFAIVAGHGVLIRADAAGVFVESHDLENGGVTTERMPPEYRFLDVDAHGDELMLSWQTADEYAVSVLKDGVDWTHHALRERHQAFQFRYSDGRVMYAQVPEDERAERWLVTHDLVTGELHRVYQIVPDENAYEWDVDGDLFAASVYIHEGHPSFNETGRTLYVGCAWKTCQWQRPGSPST